MPEPLDPVTWQRVASECLRLAHEYGDCGWYTFACSLSAHGGHLACLKYAHEVGCPWDKNTYAYAAAGGHSECLAYLRDNGCPQH